MEEVIKLFKDITEVGNKTGADKVNLTLDTANEIVKYIDSLEAKNESLIEDKCGLENEISNLEEEISNLLEMVES